MKKIRRGFALLLTLAMAMALCVPVFAADVDKNTVDVESLDDYAAEGIVVTAVDTEELEVIEGPIEPDDGRPTAPMAREVVDLSEESRSIDWDLPAQTTWYTTNFYKTNSQKIKVHLKGDIKVSLTVSLYSSAGTLIGTKTKDVGTVLGTDYSFSGLTSSENYYVKIVNNGTNDVNVTGTISQ